MIAQMLGYERVGSQFFGANVALMLRSRMNEESVSV